MPTPDKKEPTGFLGCVIAARELRCKSPYAPLKKSLMQYYASNVHDDSCTFYKSLMDISFDTGLSERFITKMNAAWRKINILTWDKAPIGSGLSNTYRLDLKRLQEAAKQSRDTSNVANALDHARLKHRERQQRYRKTLKERESVDGTKSVTTTA